MVPEIADAATAHCDKDDLERKADVIDEVAASLDSAPARVSTRSCRVGVILD